MYYFIKRKTARRPSLTIKPMTSVVWKDPESYHELVFLSCDLNNAVLVALSDIRLHITLIGNIESKQSKK